MIFLYIFFIASILLIYFKSKGKYDAFIQPLDKKQYAFKDFMSIGFYILDLIKYTYNTKYDKKLQNKFSQLYSRKQSSYFLRVHWANKLTMLAAVLLVFSIIGIATEINSTGGQQVSQDSVKIIDGNKIIRPQYKEGNKDIILTANIKKGQVTLKQNYDIEVEKITPSEQEAVAYAKEYLTQEKIKGKNPDLQNVTGPLQLLVEDKSIRDLGVTIQWESSDPDVIQKDGTVKRPTQGEGNKNVILTAKISKGNITDTKEFNVQVLEYEKLNDEQVVSMAAGKLLEMVRDKKELMIQEPDKLVLPTRLDINGQQVDIKWSRYSPENANNKGKPDFSIIIFVVILLWAIAYLTDNQIDRKIQDRALLIKMDFPDFLNKLILLVNAGMTVSKAMEKITYENKKLSPLYMELELTMAEMSAGVSEYQAYENFAERCGIPEISKYVSILLQNLRKGNAELVSILRIQAKECWEMRKNAAKKLGEEASTKLLLPLMIMMLAIIIIVGLPAVLLISGI